MAKPKNEIKKTSKITLKSNATMLHVDMDAFFASCEIARNPSLKNKPVGISSDHPRSVISTANYIARKFGVHAGLGTFLAKRRCPQIILIPPDIKYYSKISYKLCECFAKYTPNYEQTSIDEAFLDVSGALRIFESPKKIAELIKEDIKKNFNLDCSIGIGVNKSIAKIASKKAKPQNSNDKDVANKNLGILIISPQQTIPFLSSLKVKELWGVGPKTVELLKSIGISNVSELEKMPLEILEKTLGNSQAEYVLSLANGGDLKTFTSSTKSIGSEITVEKDLTDIDAIKTHLLSLSDKVCFQLRESQFCAKTITLVVKTADKTRYNKSMSLQYATAKTDVVYSSLCELLKKLLGKFNSFNQAYSTPIRLVGVRLSGLLNINDFAFSQLDLFSNQKSKSIQKDFAVDKIKNNFGSSIIKRAALVKKSKKTEYDKITHIANG